MTKRLLAGLCALALLFVISAAATVQAQAATGPLGYDVSQEVTLNGAVSGVFAKPVAGMIMGSHLLLATPSGRVDASLGGFGLRGKATALVATGQQIEVTGVMKTIRDKQVFLVRSLKVNGEVYTIRNEHGFSVSPQARQRASQKTAGEGQ
jgi:hypothetical protein